jgi:hypothetical protein
MERFQSLFDQSRGTEDEEPLAMLASLLEDQPTASEPTPLARAASAMDAAPAAPPGSGDGGARRKPFIPAMPPDMSAAAPAGPTQAPAKGKGGAPTRQDVLGTLASGIGEEEAGIRRGAEVQGEKGRYLAEQNLLALQDQAEASELLGKAREDIQRQAGERVSRVNAEIEDLGKQTPDPKRYFRDQGTLGNILTLIGVALGGYSAAKTGKNVPLEMLQREIDRDVEAQAREYQQGLTTLQERRGAAREEMAMGLDSLEFKVARQVDANNRVMQMISAAASRYDSEDVQARAAQAIGQLRQKNAGLLEDIRGKAVSEAQEGARIGLASRAQRFQEKAWQMDFGEKQRQFDISTMAALQKAQAEGDTVGAKRIKEEREHAVFAIQDPTTGKEIAAPSPKVAEDLNAKIGAADEAFRNVDEIISLVGDKGYLDRATGGERERRAATITSNLQTAISQLTAQGVITGGDAERLKEQFGSITAWNGNADQLRQLQGIIVDKVNTAVRARTGVKAATWRGDANPDYATTVRPPGFQPRSTVELGEPAAALNTRPAGAPSKEAYQQRQARELKALQNLEPEAPGPRINPSVWRDAEAARRRLAAPDDEEARLAEAAGKIF